MAQCQLISDVDDEGYILKEVAIICIKDRGTRHLKQGVCFEGLAIPNRACHKYNSGAKQRGVCMCMNMYEKRPLQWRAIYFRQLL